MNFQTKCINFFQLYNIFFWDTRYISLRYSLLKQDGFGELSPQEDVGLSITKEERNPFTDGWAKVEEFQTFINVPVAKRVESLTEIN